MSARQARLALADSRAMEEQAERTNPINPKRQIGSRKGRTALVAEGDEYTGGGATPSMGLSQYRGGAIQGCGEHDEELVGSGIVGAGRAGAGRAGAGKKPKASEAHEMGHHLGKHLHELHGGGFFDDFARGFMSVIRPVANIASFIPGPVGMAARLASGVLGSGASGAGKKPRGKGKLTITHGGGNVSGPGYEAVSGIRGGGDMGAGRSGAGRSARAELVKKVMRERGVKMIEASKIVKAEGLY